MNDRQWTMKNCSSTLKCLYGSDYSLLATAYRDERVVATGWYADVLDAVLATDWVLALL